MFPSLVVYLSLASVYLSFFCYLRDDNVEVHLSLLTGADRSLWLGQGSRFRYRWSRFTLQAWKYFQFVFIQQQLFLFGIKELIKRYPWNILLGAHRKLRFLEVNFNMGLTGPNFALIKTFFSFHFVSCTETMQCAYTFSRQLMIEISKYNLQNVHTLTYSTTFKWSHF